MKALGRFLRALAKGLAPAVAWTRPLVAVLAAVPTIAAAVIGEPFLAATVALATILAAVFVGSFRAWLTADTRVREYEGDTELQQGIAGMLREGRELRNRIAASPEQGMRHLEREVPSWSWSTHQFLNNAYARELADEFASLEGIDPTDRAKYGPLPREGLLDYLYRALALLSEFKRRLRPD